MEFLRAIARNTGNLVALAIAAAVVFAVAGTFLVAACGGVAPLPPGESCMQCAREWIGSLSGWVAAGAAFITVVYLKQANAIAFSSILHERRERLRIDHEMAVSVDAVLEVAINDLLDVKKKFEAKNSTRNKSIYSSIGKYDQNIRDEADPKTFHAIELAWKAMNGLREQGISPNAVRTDLANDEGEKIDEMVSKLNDLRQMIQDRVINTTKTQLEKIDRITV